MAGVLDGLKVVSMELMEAIPAASVWLADWGAEVIKVEPLTGDMFRGTGRVGGVLGAVKLPGGEVKWTFECENRNKKSLAVDLKTEPGRDILYKLIPKADIFMSNYELGAIQRLKVDYATLSKLNPRLIYGALSGYGSVGPDKGMGGYDRVSMWARGGHQHMLTAPGTSPPGQRHGVMDRTAAAHAVAGVLAALYHREKTGEGQEIEFSLYQSAVWTLALDIQAPLVGLQLPIDDRTKAGNPLWNFYRTKDKDDRWFMLGMLRSDPYWSDFCQVMGKPELENDPRFNNMNTRRENCEELVRILDEVFASKTIDEWDKCFKPYNLIYSKIQTPEEVTKDPQALANDFFVDLNHPAGEMKVVASPVKFFQNPASVRTIAPEIGQHTEEILLELGYSWEDIAGLKEQGVIL
ncbi:CaiB/BaiF CoA transferase family protein [Chloroflexota bacterium]